LGDAIDQVLVLVMRGPGSATGEDVIEVSCHGGLLAPRLILRRLAEEGARPAEPGEFTRRAFVNGKIDLAQAEAVEKIVRAGSEGALKAAARQLKGELSRRLEALEQPLLKWLVRMEAEIDFVEEAIENVDRGALAGALNDAAGSLGSLVEAYDRGKYAKDAVDVAIVGRPNAGKSSLFNRLVGRDRVIVSEYPGTTRDTVDGLVAVDGVILRVHDTAGVRQTADVVEKEAVRRALQAMEDADIALVVLDASIDSSSEDRELLEAVTGKASVIVANKMDLPEARPWTDSTGLGSGALPVSALEGTGISHVADRLAVLAREKTGDLAYDVIASERHAACLRNALVAIKRGAAGLDQDVPLEFIASDLRCALDCLGEVTGKKVTSTVLDEIFSQFCIGK
jgi:tRNA modification GTPase